MKILVFGGNGFVGLNIATALLARGHAVTLFDRAGLPPAAAKDLVRYADRLTAIQGDVIDRQTVEDVIAAGYEAIILGAAVTLGRGTRQHGGRGTQDPRYKVSADFFLLHGVLQRNEVRSRTDALPRHASTSWHLFERNRWGESLMGVRNGSVAGISRARYIATDISS